MANPLIDLQKLVNPKKVKTFTAVVVSVNGQKVKVKLNTNNEITVWGTAKVGDTVLIQNAQIVAVVDKEKINTVFVP